MAIKTAQNVITLCSDLREYWGPRNRKFEKWYEMIELVDKLATEKMESFVGPDPRAMFNLVLHLLDQTLPHRVRGSQDLPMAESKAASELSANLALLWRKNQRRFRKSGPWQTEQRRFISFLLATGWYARFAITSDDGESVFVEPWNPAEVFPMWYHGGLSECAHIFEMPLKAAHAMMDRSGWAIKGQLHGTQTVYDYWYLRQGETFPFTPVVWNAVVIGTNLVKNEMTRFRTIPIFTGPVGGLPDTGVLSRNASLSTSFSIAHKRGERWKEEIGQSIIATNETVYNTWNKWWTYGLQLLRDTAQPRIFERSQSNKAIVKPEDIWRRGAIFRGGPNDSVEFLPTPVIPLELRQNQIDLEAMMQRGGVSWAMYGDQRVQMTTFMMSQIAVSANQVMKPFHDAVMFCAQDIDEEVFIVDMQERGVRPYGVTMPTGLPEDIEIDCRYELKIPGEIIQKATVSRMLDPDWRMPSKFVLQEIWPDITDYVQHDADIQADAAKRHPMNATIALIDYYKKVAKYLATVVKDAETAKLYEAAAETLAAQSGLSSGTGAPAPGPESPPLLPEGVRTDTVQTPNTAMPSPLGMQ